jgi:hypothetical protein
MRPRFTVANMLKAMVWFAICCVALTAANRSLVRVDLNAGERLVRLIVCFTAIAVTATIAIATLFGMPKVGYALGYAIAFVIVPAAVAFLIPLAMLVAWLI